MPAKSLPVEDLRLDLKNPRIAEASSQRDALQKIIDDQDAKLVALAESIVEDGLNPMDRFLVIASQDEAGKFVAIEGNRRLAAIKVLRNPTVLTGMEVRPAVQKRLEALAADFDRASLETLDCFEVGAREDGAMWIQQRHTGENEGRGIVDWGGVATARFRGNDPALQALDFVLQRGDLDSTEKTGIANRFPISTLDRLLSTPAVRSAVGVELKGGKLLSALPFAEVMRPLQRIVRDLATGAVTVTHLKLQPQMVAYVGRLGSDLPNLSTASGSPVPVEDLYPPSTSGSTGSGGAGSSGGAAGEGSGGGSGGGGTSGSATSGGASTGGVSATRGKKKPSRGSALIPKSCKLRVANAKISEIEKELRALPVATYPHAISVLFRVFLELSVDEFLRSHGGSTTFSAPGGKTVEKSLQKKVEEAVAQMVAAGAPKAEFKGITKALSDKHNPLHIDTLHSYVHNAFYSPTDRDLTVAWDNAQPFFERLWP